ncbi:MAG TPA: Crp/Fnr family transcriptional regulator [Burkholderiales bacterium]|nr:Crp/Fnr family transcriptional regulator [Burkholderiales bacterium]
MHQDLPVRDIQPNGNGASRDPRLLEGVLANVPLFRGVAQHQVADLAARAKAIHFRRGATVCGRGRCLPGLYAIAYGQVKLAFRSEDEERVARIVGPVETFGLAAAILGRPAPYEAVALDDSLLVMVPSAAVLQMVENDPRFARAVITDLAERTMKLLAEVETAALHGGVQRLAGYLDALAGNGENRNCTVRLPTTKTVIASRLGIKKETLSRLLRDLAHRGLIAVEQREIAIHDRPGLAALAREEA